MIISHRGRGFRLPENTIPAFEAARCAGADAIECDLRLTADGYVVVHHDDTVEGAQSKLSIRRHTLAELRDLAAEREASLPVLDDLLAYLHDTRLPVYMEVKSVSPLLAAKTADAIGRHGMWEQASVIGFPGLVFTAIRAKDRYPMLRVWRLLLFPAASTVVVPSSGDGVMLGWLDSIRGSQAFFRAVHSAGGLSRLQRRCQRRGMGVIAGVINNTEGWDLFRRAGIRHVVTDRVADAVAYGRALLV